MASKSYGWDVRNIAKISPKMAKKPPFFDFFRFSQKLSIRFERNFLQLFYTILESYMCNGIKIVTLGCEKHGQNSPKNGKKGHFSTSEGKRPKPTPLPHMPLWFILLKSPFLVYYCSNFGVFSPTFFAHFRRWRKCGRWLPAFSMDSH